MAESARKVKVGLVQMQCGPDPAANVARALELTRAVAKQGAQIICLPELFRSRYFCQTEDPGTFDLAEPIPGPTSDAFVKLAGELQVGIIASLFERRAPGLYHNTVAIVDGRRGLTGMYRKMHIPDDPRYYEKYYFTPGDLGFKAFPLGNTTIGTLICWDQWYPEAARLTALRGAEILFYPTAIGWHREEKAEFGPRQRDAWETAQRAHAIANGCFVVAVNRCGFEPDPASKSGGGIEFWGSSFIVGPDGVVLFRAPESGETVHAAELDLGLIARQRHGWPFLRDRRIDAYADITRRFVEP
ncbi:MAG: carbon-nitrogen hydrolase [Gammaproteobacteria bacterium]|nr:carbon-nitrogen hydrolase [Gammaproteobacteria bacterium]